MSGTNKVFNISLGKVKYYAEQVGTGNAALVVVLLKLSGLEADATLLDHDNLSVLLASTNDEADFTNYARKIVTAATISNPDDESLEIGMADQVYTDAGGATNNTIGKALICFDADTTTGADTAIIPLIAHDVDFTTVGDTINLRATSGLVQITS